MTGISENEPIEKYFRTTLANVDVYVLHVWMALLRIAESFIEFLLLI